MKLVCVLVVCVIVGLVHGATQEQLDAFSNWVDENGAVRNFDLTLFPGQGAGGVASKPLTEEDVLLRVPDELLVYSMDHKDINGWNDWKGNAEPLMIWIQREQLKGDNSFYKPYIDILPQSFEEHPLLWKEEDFVYASNTRLLEFHQSQLPALQNTYARLQQTLFKEFPDEFPEEHFTWNRYLWSYIAVTSRAWMLEKEGVADLVLVPLADMLNHKNGCGQGGLNREEMKFEINSTQTYAPGEQVYDSYGPKTNFQLLTTYGFIPDYDNQYNGAILQFALNENNLVHETIKPILESADPGYNSISVTKYEIPHNLLRIYRLSSLEFSELDNLDDVIAYKGFSLQNEWQAMRISIASLQNVIATYPSKEEDDANLAKEGLSDKDITSIRLRQSEKQVLENQIPVIQQLWQRILLDGELIGGKKV